MRSPIDVEKGSPSYYIGFGNSFNSVSISPRISSESMAMGSLFKVKFSVDVKKIYDTHFGICYYYFLNL